MLIYDTIEKSFKEDYKKWIAAARRRGVSLDAAEDIVQETFTRALYYKNSYDSSRPFDGWIYTILTNAYKDRMKEERMLGMSVEFNEEIDGWYTHDMAGDVLSEISRDIYSQSQPNRDIFNLYFLKEYKPRDIAKVLDVTCDSVRSAVKRYRKTLEERYGEKVHS